MSGLPFAQRCMCSGRVELVERIMRWNRGLSMAAVRGCRSHAAEAGLEVWMMLS